MSPLRTTRRRSISSAPRALSRGVSSVARSSREGNVPIAPRIAIAGVLGAMIIGILVLRLWALTVIGGAEYAERADSNVIRKLPVAAPRGSILDRDGRKIVVNVETQQVVLDLQDVDDERLAQVVSDLGRVLAPRPGLADEGTADIQEKVDNAPPGAVEPVVVAPDVTRMEVIAYLAEHAADFPGVDVRPAYKRRYRHKTAAAHILGQVGAVDQADLDAHPTLQPIDKVGKSGLEKRYDEYLRGVNGYDAVQVDAAGVRTDVAGLRGLPPTPGRNLVTTIDLPLQKATERALVDGVHRAAGTHDGRDAKAGAAVAIDPNTGEVLALASYPTYDPNVFGSTNPRDEDTSSWLVNPHNKKMPMLNRATSGTYPPGSIFKPVTAIAAMAEGFMEPDDLISCPPALEIAQTVFKNHDSTHLGSIDLPTAIETSCDTYFYALAVSFFNDPHSPQQDWAKRFGLGQPTGLDLPGEASGVVPTKEWKATVPSEIWTKTDRIWKPGDNVNLSIGQGDLLVTPLQMTNVYATIANGGKVYTPHLARSVEDLGGNEEAKLPVPEPRDLQLDPGDLAAVVEGLRRVNEGGNGTATAVFGSYKVSTAGKSGTAEKFGQSDLAWYCAFAPIEKPTIAACAFVDGGGTGGTTSAPIVKRMFDQWFAGDGKDATSAAGEEASG
jgi:penicillin-binding protein 2